MRSDDGPSAVRRSLDFTLERTTARALVEWSWKGDSPPIPEGLDMPSAAQATLDFRGRAYLDVASGAVTDDARTYAPDPSAPGGYRVRERQLKGPPLASPWWLLDLCRGVVRAGRSRADEVGGVRCTRYRCVASLPGAARQAPAALVGPVRGRIPLVWMRTRAWIADDGLLRRLSARWHRFAVVMTLSDFDGPPAIELPLAAQARG